MDRVVEIYDDFLSSKLFNKIVNDLSQLEIEDYHKIKSLLSWLPEEVLKEKKVIKYSEIISGIEFSNLSKEIRAHIAIKHGLNASDTQIHFDNRVYLNIVVPIFMRNLNSSGLIIFPFFSSLLLRPFLRFKFISKLIRNTQYLRNFLKIQNIDYKINKGYFFKGNKFAHGVFYSPRSEDSLRAVLTINFKRF